MKVNFLRNLTKSTNISEMLILASPAMCWEWHYLRELVVVVYFITTSAAPNSLKAGKSRVNPTGNSGNWWQIPRIVTCPLKGSHPQLQQPCPQSVCFPSLQHLGLFCLQVQDWSHTAIVEPSLWCMMVWGATLDCWKWQGGMSIWNRLGTWKFSLKSWGVPMCSSCPTLQLGIAAWKFGVTA